MRHRPVWGAHPQALLGSCSRRVHRRGEPRPAKPLEPFQVDQAHGDVWHVLLDKPVEVAGQGLAHPLSAHNRQRRHGCRAPFSERPGLQDGLSQERQHAVAATVRCALYLDDVRVPSALRQQGGAKIAARRRPPDLPAGPAEQVSDPLFKAFAPGCAHVGWHDVFRMVTAPRCVRRVGIDALPV